MTNKSFTETLATFKEISNDIDSVIGESGSSVGSTLLRNIRCTM